MRIVAIRRLTQALCLLLFLWFCVVSTVGAEWWQLRGWPVNLFLQLDPLAALGTLLATRTLYGDMALAAGTILLTVVFGRFFCGWVCPFGTLHQFAGWVWRRRQPLPGKVNANQHRAAQSAKYYFLLVLLSAAAGSLIASLTRLIRVRPAALAAVVAACFIVAALLVLPRRLPRPAKLIALALVLVAGWTGLSLYFPMDRVVAGSLQTGLLDPIPLMHRSVNLFLLPLAARLGPAASAVPGRFVGAGLIAAVFLAALALNFVIPRFYCRFICPLGALLGIVSRYSLWRIGKTRESCSMCFQCEADCEGACQPATQIRAAECVLCMNCLRACPDEVIAYRVTKSAAGEAPSPDLMRRGVIASIASGFLAVPAMRLSDALGANFNPRLIRPPGALDEENFLLRCIKCGQCMRVCPTNVIQPAGLEAGVEGIWTPALNFRIGTSGCQLNCVACGNLCPTGAIRPITLDEKLGRGLHAPAGPVRLGTAFVDQGRCLPWAMDKPCIVCQENCPVSPKAIYTREVFVPLRDPLPPGARADELTIDFARPVLAPGRFGNGDYYCAALGESDGAPRRIVDNTASTLTIESNTPWDPPPAAGSAVEIRIRLQRPFVDPEKCIGCGICEHECPVAGLRAIRVTAENETRDPRRRIVV